MNSKWGKWITQPGHIRIVAVEATELMRQMCTQQKLQGIAQVGYAESVVASLLIASGHKSSESINLNAQGSSVYKQAIIDASPEGRVRGFLIEEKDGSMHTFGADGTNGPWGSGILSILFTKNSEGKSPYKGMVAISTGHLDEALNEYFRDSEQVTSCVGLSVEIEGDQLLWARGVIVQALGGASDAELAEIGKMSRADARTLAASANDFETFAVQAAGFFKNRSFDLLEEKPLESFCTCSRERIERALLLSGEPDIMEALGNDKFISITCDFCRTEYQLTVDDLKTVFSRDPQLLQ